MLNQFLCFTIVSLFSFLAVSSASAAILKKERLWKHKAIKVCFLDDFASVENKKLGKRIKEIFKPGMFTNQEQDFIRDTINEAFSIASTGIFFFGWDACKPNGDHDVTLTKAIAPAIINGTPLKFTWYGRGVIGNGTMASGKTMTPYISLRVVNRVTVLHEFSHSAGLYHEHISPQAKNDPACYKPKGREKWHEKHALLEESYGNTIHFNKEYDKDSITNWCNVLSKKESTDISLSEIDERALRELYLLTPNHKVN